MNAAAGFLSRVTQADGDQGVDEYEEGDLVNLTVDEEVFLILFKRMLEYFESDLQDVARHLDGVSLKSKT